MCQNILIFASLERFVTKSREGLFYPNTTHFSSQGGYGLTAAEAFEYCGRWRNAVKPMLNQWELKKSAELYNRLRSLVQTRRRNAT